MLCSSRCGILDPGQQQFNACDAGWLPVSKRRHHFMFHMAVKDHQSVASWRHKRHLFPTCAAILPASPVVKAQLAAIDVVVPA